MKITKAFRRDKKRDKRRYGMRVDRNLEDIGASRDKRRKKGKQDERAEE